MDHLGDSDVVVGAIVVDFRSVVWIKCTHIDCFVVRLGFRWNGLVLCIFLVRQIQSNLDYCISL